MRTTLTLDDDTCRLIEEAVHRERTSFKAVVNDAIRKALGPPAAAAPYRVEVHQARLQPGVDPHRMNQLADELEDDAILAEATRNRASR